MEHICKIKLDKTDDARDFVQQASKCDFDVDVFYNRIVIDAKSILGVLSLDLTKVLTVRFAHANPAFEAYLRKFSVA